MKISITLPSIYPEALGRCLDSVAANTHGPYEVIVASPFPVDRPNVIWVQESERRGCNHAQNIAGQHVTGDLVMGFSDDYLCVAGWDTRVKADFLEREAIHGGNYVMAVRYDAQWVGTTFGMLYANFPLTRRKNLARYGWYDGTFRAGFGDCDLSMRFWDGGGVCEFSREILLLGTPDDARKAGVLLQDGDLERFVARWAPKFGAGWNTGTLRDFNIDVVPERAPQILRDRTVNVFKNPDMLRDFLVAAGYEEFMAL